MYDNDWWLDYALWRDETKQAHTELLNLLWRMPYNHATVDLGCGKLMMGRDVTPYNYVGVDIDPHPMMEVYSWKDLREEAVHEKTAVVKQPMESIDWEEVVAALAPRPVSVISLFAAELYLAEPEKLYERAFMAGVSQILSVGVRYPSAHVSSPVGEPGAYVWQTSCAETSQTHWDEMRVTKHVPSKMFGPDVVEVWRKMACHYL